MKQVLINSSIILMVLFIWTCGDDINSGNEILSLTASDSLVEAGGSVLLVCTAVDEDGLTYIWGCSNGSLLPNGNIAIWTAPGNRGTYSISCEVTDGNDGSIIEIIDITVQ